MAHVIETDRSARASGGPGLSYLVGTKVFNAPLMMPLQAAQQLKAAIDARAFDTPGGTISLGGPSLSKFAGTPAGRSGYRVTDDGIAIIPVSGMLFDRGDWLGDFYGMATSYEGLAEQVRRIIKDDAIKAVILDIDSPGGMAAGCFDFAGEVLTTLRKAKRIYAIAQNDACSGAYAIAAAAHEVYVTGLGRAGSIGVITLHQSYHRALDAAGIDTTIIYAGDHKPNGNAAQPLSHIARAEMTAAVDEIHNQFVRHVAKSRGIVETAVRDLQARTFLGPAAVAAGLADGVKTFDQVLALARGGSSRAARKTAQTASARAGTPAPGETPMPHADDQVGAERQRYEQMIADGIAALAAHAQTQPAAPAPVAAPAVATAPVVPVVAAAPAVATVAAPVDARARIKAIVSCEAAKTRPGLAQHIALETDLDPTTAAAVLAAAPAEGATAGGQHPLFAAMRQPGASAGIKPDSTVGADGTRASAAAGLPSLADKTKAQAAAKPKPAFARR